MHTGDDVTAVASRGPGRRTTRISERPVAVALSHGLTMATLVLHINRETIYHAAEVCLLRDLHLHTNGAAR